MIGRYLVAGALLFLIVYGLIEAYPLLSGPTLEISSPLADTQTTGPVVLIAGKVAHTVSLTLNSSPLLTSADGTFKKELAFPHGSSILTFVATDRFGRSVTTTRTIYVP